MKSPKAKTLDMPDVISTNLRRNFLWNLVGTTVFSFTSLFFMMIVTRLNGIDDAGVFTFAFSTASLFQVIGTYSGRTFQVTDKNKKTTDSDYFYAKFVTCGIMLLVSLLFCLIRGYSGEKFIIIATLIIYRVIEAISESTYAVIQKQNRLYQVGQSLFLKSFVSLISFWLVDSITHNLIISCLTIIISHVIFVLAFDLPRLLQSEFHFAKFDPKKVLYLLKIGFFTFGFSILNLYIINAARFAIDATASASAQTIYSIVLMPATIITLVGQYFMQPFLTSLKHLFSTDFKKFQSLILKLCLAICIFGVLAVASACLLGIPVLELLYAIDLDGNLPGLLLIIVGGVLCALTMIISTGLITMRRTGTQFWVYLFVAALALILSRPLVQWGGVFGGCLDYLLSMAALLVLYIIIFIHFSRKFRQNPTEELRRASQE